MNIFISLALNFIKANFRLDYVIVIGFLIWIKFNDLHHIGIWQKEHKQRSDELYKDVKQHGKDIAALTAGKADK